MPQSNMSESAKLMHVGRARMLLLQGKKTSVRHLYEALELLSVVLLHDKEISMAVQELEEIDKENEDLPHE